MNKFLLVGLGNIGDKYTNTRHNAGFWLIERLGSNFKFENKFNSIIASTTLSDKQVILALPTTFMNNSGISVRALADYYKIELNDIIIAHDEIDLPVGSVKLKLGGGSGGHNGLKSITSHLNTTEYKRIRIGVGRPVMSSMVSDYVLSPISKESRKEIELGTDKIIENIELIINDFAKAQNLLNSKN